ncbi:MAG TPA: zinc ribbon domain-containing protein [Aggregatilineaceae bacterium]|nr:zinc ribbon domain-containing protein [Aggregatilineaceae bacterium]
MPVYEYRCTDCLTVFEVRRSMSAPEQAEACPHCQGMQNMRVYSAPNLGGVSHSSSGESYGHEHSHGGGCAGCGSGNCGSCHH